MPQVAAAPNTLARVATDLQLKSVLVATDFDPTSDKAIRYAAAVARRYGSKFYLLHVVSSLGYTMAGPDALVAATELAWKDARQAERELTAQGTLRDIEHDVIVSAGDVWPQVESVVREKNIDLLVLGTHSRHGIGRLVLGSVAESIFRHASCPVLTIGPNSPGRAETVIASNLRPLVFATDLSYESLLALPYAISFANRRKTKLILLHVLSPVPHVEGSRWYTAGDVVQMRTEAADNMKARLLELVSGVDFAVEPVSLAEYGLPVECIVEAARNLNALGIVLGLKPHNDTISHMPWSTAYQIVCEAPCPVLTVRR